VNRTATAMTVSEPGGSIAASEVELSAPPRGHVRVTVFASGVCNADLATADARRSGTRFPVTPGHEVAGVVAELGEDVAGWDVGDRVAVGWYGGSCGHCDFCRSGDPVHCADRKTPGISYPGGWAETITVPADALARIPDELSSFDAAPFGCAGVTTFNAIRRAPLTAGARVVVFGIGGLGHLAVQFAAKLGYEVVAIARGADRETLALSLGASSYIDSTHRAPGRTLAELGGADLIVYTASSTEPVDELITGLRVGGRLTLIGVDAGSVTVPVAQLVMNAQVITGHLTGSALDIEETMRFAVANDIHPMTERLPLERAAEGVERVRDGSARFRVVLDARSGR
jgi:D-arabinose 1-dehydrogenase-like Zn-dependent alcohol dehydrogenase